jgi:hypothetical protein
VIKSEFGDFFFLKLKESTSLVLRIHLHGLLEYYYIMAISPNYA